ncbi:MAG: hypothetical protein AAFU86_02885 [Pseudomonadota bacterium]
MTQAPNRQSDRWRMAAIKAPLQLAFGQRAPDGPVPRRLAALLEALRRDTDATAET